MSNINPDTKRLIDLYNQMLSDRYIQAYQEQIIRLYQSCSVTIVVTETDIKVQYPEKIQKLVAEAQTNIENYKRAYYPELFNQGRQN